MQSEVIEKHCDRRNMGVIREKSISTSLRKLSQLYKKQQQLCHKYPAVIDREVINPQETICYDPMFKLSQTS